MRGHVESHQRNTCLHLQVLIADMGESIDQHWIAIRGATQHHIAKSQKSFCIPQLRLDFERLSKPLGCLGIFLVTIGNLTQVRTRFGISRIDPQNLTKLVRRLLAVIRLQGFLCPLIMNLNLLLAGGLCPANRSRHQEPQNCESGSAKPVQCHTFSSLCSQVKDRYQKRMAYPSYSAPLALHGHYCPTVMKSSGRIEPHQFISHLHYRITCRSCSGAAKLRVRVFKRSASVHGKERSVERFHSLSRMETLNRV